MMPHLLFFAEEWFKQYETVESLKTVATLEKNWKVERILKLKEALEVGKNLGEALSRNWRKAKTLQRYFSS